MKAGSGSRAQPRFQLRASPGNGIPGLSAEAEVAGVKNSLYLMLQMLLFKILFKTQFCRRFLQSWQTGGGYW